MPRYARTRAAEQVVLEILEGAEEISWDDLQARAAIAPARLGDAVETLLAAGAIRVIRRAVPPAAFALRREGRSRARRTDG